MSKVMVIYDSKTGFTKRMAEAVVEGVKDIIGVDVELVKVGTPFSISKLESADALILGSPTIYGNVTQDMNTLLQSLRVHKEAQRLELSGKIGGVFGSYGWDGGWVVEILRKEVEDLGIKVVADPVSLADGQEARYEIHIADSALNNCRALGRTVAKEAANKG